MAKPRYPRDVQVEVLKESMPGIRVRILSDRDAGCLIWETEYLNEDGTVRRSESRRMEAEELLNIRGIMRLLERARSALTPRTRLDIAKLNPPARREA